MKSEVVRKRINFFTLPVDLVENIKELAGKEKKSGSRVVEELIRESLRNRKRSELEKIAISSKRKYYLNCV
ncbi:MAG: ribbon-helix-helix protein, CopG family [Thermodesulfobacterium sp.]|nr:ribbon-helix-helix protein, CopG family [Thermodesulfobacterium sp.]